MSIRADSLAAHGAEGRNGGDVRLGELQYMGEFSIGFLRPPFAWRRNEPA